MTSTQVEQVEVTQADRDAAWYFIPTNSIAGQDMAGFFDGKYDESNTVQAFARHRIEATRTPSLATGEREAREIVDALSKAVVIEALKPFAKDADNFRWPVHEPDSRAINNLGTLTVGDLRRAREVYEALASQSPADDGDS